MLHQHITAAKVFPQAPFVHSPMRGHFQMVAYDRDGGPVEYMFSARRRSETQMVDRANFEAIYLKARRVAVRNDKGTVLYDGPTLNALCGPAFADGDLARASESFIPAGGAA